MEYLIEELERIEELKRELRSRTMVYQYDLKVEVMRRFNLAWEQVNVAYPCWSTWRAIHNFFREDLGCSR